MERKEFLQLCDLKVFKKFKIEYEEGLYLTLVGHFRAVIELKSCLKVLLPKGSSCKGEK